MRFQRLFILCALGAAVLLPLVFRLDAFLAADEKQWGTNTRNFLDRLATGRWSELLQQPHPGIPTQWLGAITVLSDSWTTRKLPLVLGQGALIGAIGYLAARLWGAPAGVLLTLLLAWNPVLVAHIRVYAMDSLLALWLLISILLLFLWRAHGGTRYLVAAASAGALAVLSKLPGVLIVPWTLGAFAWWWVQTKDRTLGRAAVLWVVTFLLTLPIVLPSLLLDPLGHARAVADYFTSDAYRELHRAPWFFYSSTLLFSSTPLHLLALVLLPFLWRRRAHAPFTREHIILIGLFAVLFLALMTVGAKKGDRYILPVFLLLDTVVVAIALWLARAQVRFSKAFLILGCGLLLWQGVLLRDLHPYFLAYVNPLAKPLLGDRRMGWGEGLDLAAAYLNAKPDAPRMTVAAYYPNEFAYRFRGRVIPLNHFEQGEVRYVVLYRAMFERGSGAWETEILEQFRRQAPEKVIALNGIDYVWVYERPRVIR